MRQLLVHAVKHGVLWPANLRVKHLPRRDDNLALSRPAIGLHEHALAHADVHAARVEEMDAPASLKSHPYDTRHHKPFDSPQRARSTRRFFLYLSALSAFSAVNSLLQNRGSASMRFSSASLAFTLRSRCSTASWTALIAPTICAGASFSATPRSSSMRERFVT